MDLHRSFAFGESLFHFKLWKLAYHPTSKNTPVIIPHSHLSWASFKHFLKFVDFVLWFAISKSAIFKDNYFSMMFHFSFAYVGYGKLQSPQKQWINNHMTFGDTEALYRLVLLCSSVKSIVVLHNSTAVLME